MINFGLKRGYNFREVKIPCGTGKEDYLRILLYEVGPAIEQLEDRKLINGFHFIRHDDFDLRISSADWSKKPEIQEVLITFGIDGSLLTTYCDLEDDLYGVITSNFLEIISRSILISLFNGRRASKERSLLDLRTNQNHYMSNLFGLTNWEEALDHFRDGKHQSAVALCFNQISLFEFQQEIISLRKDLRSMLRETKKIKWQSSEVEDKRRERVIFIMQKVLLSKNAN